jgi:hypothetical protein
MVFKDWRVHMSKILTYSTIFFIVLSSTAQISFAESFSKTIDFSDATHDYLQIEDSYSYSFNLDLGIEFSDFNIDNATLYLSHQGNSNSPAEVWFASSAGNVPIGQLRASPDDFVLDSWSLNQDVLNEMEAQGPWSLTVRLLSDTGNGVDKLKIDYSTLSGNYSDPPPIGTAVPEPGTFLLLGAGLLGVGFVRKGLKR